MLNKQDLQTLLVLLNRVTLNGSEVDEYVLLRHKVHALANTQDEFMPKVKTKSAR